MQDRQRQFKLVNPTNFTFKPGLFGKRLVWGGPDCDVCALREKLFDSGCDAELIPADPPPLPCLLMLCKVTMEPLH